MASLFGVYVHFPWCRALCPYCDFAVAVPGRRGIPHVLYTDAVLAELYRRAPAYQGRTLRTIYIGGGTPSLWQIPCLARVIDGVREVFAGDSGDRQPLEVTLEANPVDCTHENLAAWRELGIDRLSIGVQSTNPDALAVLGRDHRQGDGVAAIERARAAGFERISADLIFGVPRAVPDTVPVPGNLSSAVRDSADTRVAAVEPSLRALAGMGADTDMGTGIGHLSVYELTIEPTTRFGSMARRGRLPVIRDHVLADMYVAVHDALEERGFEHYEISSYARPGQRSVHNQLYWHGGEYLGLGNGAASLRVRPDGSAERSSNLRSVVQYLGAHQGGISAMAERVRLTAFEWAVERIWLGLRTSDGVSERALQLVPGLVEWLEGAGLANVRDGHVRPTLRGFMVSNTIASRVVATALESLYTVA